MSWGNILEALAPCSVDWEEMNRVIIPRLEEQLFKSFPLSLPVRLLCVRPGAPQRNQARLNLRRLIRAYDLPSVPTSGTLVFHDQSNPVFVCPTNNLLHRAIILCRGSSHGFPTLPVTLMRERMRITVSPYILECDVKAARAYAAILEELSQLSLSMVRIAEDTIAQPQGVNSSLPELSIEAAFDKAKDGIERSSFCRSSAIKSAAPAQPATRTSEGA